MEPNERVEYVILYETGADPNYVTRQSPLWDLRGLPISSREELVAKDDEDAKEAFKRWKVRIKEKLASYHRYLVGEPRLIKLVIADITPNQKPAS